MTPPPTPIFLFQLLLLLILLLIPLTTSLPNTLLQQQQQQQLLPQTTLSLLFNADITVGPDGQDRTEVDSDHTSFITTAVIPLLAAYHFNYRNPIILPILNQPPLSFSTCPITIQITGMCDGQCITRRSFRHLAEYQFQTHAVVGPICSGDAGPFSIGADVLGGFPVLSYWASSPRLSDKSLYQKFARTNPSDSAKSIATVAFLKALHYRRVAVLYQNDEFGQGMAQAMVSEGSKQNLSLITFAFDQVLQDRQVDETAWQFTTQRQGMALFKKNDIHIVVVVSYGQNIPWLHRAAQLEEMDSPSTLWIWPASDSFSASSSFINHDNETREWGHGFLFLEINPWKNPTFSKFVENWRTGQFKDSINWINHYLPPHGLSNSNTSCGNDWLNVQLPNSSKSTFFQDTTNLAFDVWGYAYDAVIAYGMAACNSYRKSTTTTTKSFTMPREEELYKALLQVEFDGLSGRVTFDENGDRPPHSLTMIMRSVIKNGSNAMEFATFEQGEWIIDFTRATFRNGQVTPPLDIIPPVHDHNYLPSWAKALGYFFCATMNFICISFMIWLFLYRDERLVRLSQPTMLYLISIGCWIASWAVFCLTLDDNPDDYGNNNQPLPQSILDAACMATPVLFSSGMGIAIAALAFKTYRIWFLFIESRKGNIRARKSLVHINYIGWIVFFSQLILWSVLTAWIVTAPLVWRRIILYEDVYNNPQTSVGLCVSSTSSGDGFLITILVVFLTSLILTAWAAYLVRNLPSEVHESRYILFTVLSLCQTYFVGLPTTLVVYFNVLGRFIILSLVVFVSVSFIALFMFIPKAYRLVKGKDLFDLSQQGFLTGGSSGGDKSNHGNNNVQVNNSSSSTFVNQGQGQQLQQQQQNQGGGGGGARMSSIQGGNNDHRRIIKVERVDSASPGSIVNLKNKRTIQQWTRRGQGKKRLKPIKSSGFAAGSSMEQRSQQPTDDGTTVGSSDKSSPVVTADNRLLVTQTTTTTTSTSGMLGGDNNLPVIGESNNSPTTTSNDATGSGVMKVMASSPLHGFEMKGDMSLSLV
jgi:ABC-type branched-subunit amino acid transport system substrate-binding protein